MYNEFSPVFLE